MKVLTYKKEGGHEYARTKDVPDAWKIKYFNRDMDEIVNCRSCGKKIPYGDTYCSNEIFTIDGLWGYGVCPKCYRKERKK